MGSMASPLDSSRPGKITKHLVELGQGSPDALSLLAPLVYDHLHHLASGQMRGERSAHTLQPTALVNEAFLRLGSNLPADVRSRAQFYALAARMMRCILVDHARARATEKRGGGAALPLTKPSSISARAKEIDLESVLDIHRTLERIAARDPQVARLLEMRFFAGMTAEEAAAALEISVHTVRHDLRLGQAWLKKELMQ